jgi:hypothetical protein
MDPFRDGRAALTAGGVETPLVGTFVQTPMTGLRCLTEMSVAGSFITDRNTLASFDLNTSRMVTLYEPTDAQVAADPNAGLSDVCARAGVAAGFYQGFWSTVHGWRPDQMWCPLSIDDSGAICVQRVRGQRGIDVLIGDKTIWVSDIVGNAGATFEHGKLIVTVGRDVYVWTMTGQVFMHWFTLPPWLFDRVTYSGGWFQGWHANDGALVVWPGADLTRGRVVARGYYLEHPQVAKVGGQLHVLTTTGAGEQLVYDHNGKVIGELERRIGTLPDLPEWEPIDLTALPSPPAVTVPTYPKTDQPIGIGIIDEPDGPVLEAPGWPVTGRGVGVWFTCGTRLTETESQAAFRMARELNLPCYAYVDDLRHLDDPDLIPKAPADITYRVMLNTYPIAGESRSAFTRRIVAGFANIESRGFAAHQIDPMLCGFLGKGNAGVRTEQEVLDSHEVMWDLMRSWGLQAAWIFNWARGWNDGLARVPTLMESAKRLRAASADWTCFPGVPVEDDEMTLPTLPAADFTLRYHEFPDRWIFKGADGRWLTVSDTGAVSWRVTDRMSLTADSSFVWDGGKVYVAPRNGLGYEGKVAL